MKPFPHFSAWSIEFSNKFMKKAATVVYEHPESLRLRVLIDGARTRLAELEVIYTLEKAQVDAMQAQLFQRLRPYHLERDRLRVVLKFRRRFLDTLLREGMEEAVEVDKERARAEAQNEADYEEIAQAMESKKTLSSDDEAELKKLWKKLVNLFHPDRFASEPDKQETYGKLTAAINWAKDNGDLETLRQIADNPHGFILRQGWTNLDFDDSLQLGQLRKLWESLQAEILAVIEATNALRASAEYELHTLVAEKPELLGSVIAKQITQIEAEIVRMKDEEAKLEREIAELQQI